MGIGDILQQPDHGSAKLLSGRLNFTHFHLALHTDLKNQEGAMHAADIVGRSFRAPSVYLATAAMAMAAVIGQFSIAAAPARDLASQAARSSAHEWNQDKGNPARTGLSDGLAPLWPRLVEGEWPVRCGDCGNGVGVGALNAQGGTGEHLAAFAGSYYNSLLHGLDSDGNYLPGNWPAELYPSTSLYGMMSHPAVATLSGEDRIYSARIGGDQPRGGIPARIFALGSDGKALAGKWPVTVDGHQAYNSPALVEAKAESGSKYEETLYVSTSGDRGGLLHAFQSDGVERENFPVRVGITLLTNDPAVAPDGTVYSLGSGCTDYFSFYCWQIDGYSPNGKHTLSFPYPGSSGFYSGLSVDSEGTILTAASDRCNNPSYYVALTPKGEFKPGWPVVLARGVIYGTPSIAADGTQYLTTIECPLDETERGYHNEVALYAFDEEGKIKTGWPIRAHTRVVLGVRPAVSNIVLDREGNVTVASENLLYSYSSDGDLRPGYPVEFEDVSWLSDLSLSSDDTLYVSGRNLTIPPKEPEDNWVYALRSGEAAAAGGQLTNSRTVIDGPGDATPLPQRDHATAEEQRLLLGLKLPPGWRSPFTNTNGG